MRARIGIVKLDDGLILTPWCTFFATPQNAPLNSALPSIQAHGAVASVRSPRQPPFLFSQTQRGWTQRTIRSPFIIHLALHLTKTGRALLESSQSGRRPNPRWPWRWEGKGAWCGGLKALTEFAFTGWR